MVQLLRDGAGVRWTLPSDWDVETEHEDLVAMAPRDGRTKWWLLAWQASIDLDPASDCELRVDLEADTLRLFEETSRGLRGDGAVRPTYSALVSSTRRHLAAHTCLEVVHRSAHQPGFEAAFGQLLLPMPWGLLGVRVFTSNRRTGYTTGIREAALITSAAQERGGKPRPLPQREYDHPRHDALFPDHPLSVVRAGLAWLQSEAHLCVEGPPAVPPRTAREFAHAGRFLIPPGFARVPSQHGGATRFSRLSYSGGEWVRWLTIGSYQDTLEAAERNWQTLEWVAERHDRKQLPEGSNAQRRMVRDKADPRWLLQVTSDVRFLQGGVEHWRTTHYSLLSSGTVVITGVETWSSMHSEGRLHLEALMASWQPA